MKGKKPNLFITSIILTVIIALICDFPFNREFPIIIFIATVLFLDILYNHFNKGWIIYFIFSLILIFIFCILNEISFSVKIYITLFLVSVYIGFIINFLYNLFKSLLRKF